VTDAGVDGTLGTADDGSVTQTFTVRVNPPQPPPRSYYVNIAGDPDFSDNEYTTAAGDNANDGLTPATPKASIRAVVDAYDLADGDRLFVDTGTYNLLSNIVLTAEDSGVLIRGPQQTGHRAVLNRGNTSDGSYVFELAGATSVTLDHLAITGASLGITQNAASHSDNLTVSNCEIYANKTGIRPADNAISGNLKVTGSQIHDQSGSGVYLNKAQGARVETNQVWNNGARGVYVGEVGTVIVDRNEIWGNSSHGIEVSKAPRQSNLSNWYWSNEHR
jgi:hypothetical protein